MGDILKMKENFILNKASETFLEKIKQAGFKGTLSKVLLNDSENINNIFWIKTSLLLQTHCQKSFILFSQNLGKTVKFQFKN